MLKVVNKDKRQYDIFINDEKIVSLDIEFGSVSNKFFIVTEFLEDCSKKLGSEFDDWFKKLILDYINTSEYKIKLTNILSVLYKKYLENQQSLNLLLEELEKLKIDNNIINYDIVEAKIQDIKNLINKKINDNNISIDRIKNEFKELIQFINNHNQEVLIDNTDKIIYFCDKYINLLNIDFNSFINKKKRSKTSIFFNAKEIEKLIKTTYYLKIYSIFNKDKNLKLNHISHKIIYNKLISNISQNIITKIFNIITSKINKYHTTDKYMWEYIRVNFCKSTDFHIMHIFNWIMDSILLLCKADQNPITFLTSVIDNAVQWILRNTYETTATYTDNITTEDINYISGKDRLMNYAYDDTLSKLVAITDTIIQKKYNINIENYREAIKELKNIPISSKYITFPFLSKTLEIPYKHFTTLPCDHCYRLNFLFHYLLSNEFIKNYPTLNKILIYYTKPKNNKKISYTIENIEFFYKQFGLFLTTKNTTFMKTIIEFIMNNFNHVNFYTFKNPGFKAPFDNNIIKQIETDLIDLYCKYFSNDKYLIEDLQEKIKRII